MQSERTLRRAAFAAEIPGQIALVGCNGFIGRAVTRVLGPTLGERLILVNRSELGPFFDRWAPTARRRVADLRECGHAAMACGDADLVVDLASDETPLSAQGLDMHRVQQLARLRSEFHAALAARPGRHLILTSSGGAVYGEADGTPIAEDRAESPVGAYGRLKLAIEQGLVQIGQASDMTWTILRVANPYGPGQQFRRGQGVIAALIEASLAGTPFLLRGDGSEVRDFVHVADVAEAMAMAVRGGRGLAGEIINIGSGAGRRIRDLIGLVETAGGRRLTIETVPSAPEEIRTNILSVTKAARLLGWQPRRSLERTIVGLLKPQGDATGPSASGSVASVPPSAPPSVEQNGDKPLWFFLHIPKTAGSSLRAELAFDLAPNANVMVDHAHETLSFEARRDAAFGRFLAEHEQTRFRFASGHMRWRQVQRLPLHDPRAKLTTMLRDPVTRVISAFRYMRTPMHPTHAGFIAQFPRIEDFVDHPSSQNYMALFLSDSRSESISDIVGRLETAFAFVGLFEDYALSRAVLLRMAGVVAKNEMRVRQTPDLPENVVVTTEELHRRIRAQNVLDCEIHAQWRDRFERRRADFAAFVAAPSDRAAVTSP